MLKVYKFHPQSLNIQHEYNILIKKSTCQMNFLLYVYYKYLKILKSSTKTEQLFLIAILKNSHKKGIESFFLHQVY